MRGALPGIDAALLRPSLAAGVGARAPYSAQMGMLASFFGGPFAALAAVLLNALRLRRLRPEALALGALALVMLVADTWLLLDPAPTAALAHWLSIRPSNALHLWLRALSLAVFAAGLLLHRQRQRAAELMGLQRPRGFWVGLGLIAAGLLLQVGLAVALDTVLAGRAA
jgi:hypothetical protein